MEKKIPEWDSCKAVDVTVMLAILKAEAAYVPVDPDYPPSRKAYILHNAEAAAVLEARFR
jgi:non-ribosomal peptide synthetase component F